MSRIADDVIAEALAAAKTPCVTSSFQAEDVVLMHLLLKANPDIPVLFLETFHHFPQTLTYRDEIAGKWHLNLINLKAPEPSVGLWQTSTDDCCARHKVGPLFGALEGYDTWFTGLRRDQSPSRANLQHIEPFTLKSGKALSKVSPLADGRERTSGSTRKRTIFRCCRSTSLAIRASAASRAPRCRSIRRIRGRAAGRVRSSNAVSTSNPRNRLWALGFGLQACIGARV